jgi:hypothetical protein
LAKGKMNTDQSKLKITHQALADAAGSTSAPDYFVEMTRGFDTQEIWRDYVKILDVAPFFEVDGLKSFAPASLRGLTWAFQIVGVKVAVPPVEWNY